MTGPEHYLLAEALAALVERENPETGGVIGRRFAQTLQLSQIHATLALAAATAELDADEGPGGGSATGRSGARAAAWDTGFARSDASAGPAPEFPHLDGPAGIKTVRPDDRL
jgi:hypothetical protein